MIALVEGLLYQQYIIQGLQVSNYELINDNNDKINKIWNKLLMKH